MINSLCITRVIEDKQKNITIKQAQALAQSQRQAIRTLAHQRARQAIERRFKELGIKYRCVTYREVMVEVERYFDEHQAELCAEASERVQRWTREGFFGKRAQHFANLNNAAQNAKPQSIEASAVQNTSAERADQ